MNSKERRAAAHKDRKLARKAGFPIPQPTPPPVVVPEVPKTLKEISPVQLAANRANALHSTGPKTDAGRAISSRKRTTHGLARHNGTFVLLSSEDPNGFEAQNRKKKELRIQNERHEMKKEHHEWDVRLKDAAFCRLLQNNRPEVAKAAA